MGFINASARSHLLLALPRGTSLARGSARKAERTLENRVSLELPTGGALTFEGGRAGRPRRDCAGGDASSELVRRADARVSGAGALEGGARVIRTQDFAHARARLLARRCVATLGAAAVGER